MPAPDRSVLSRLVVVLLLGSAVVSCKRSPAASTAPPPPKVDVSHPITRELTDEDDYNGWLQSSSVVEVRSRVRGYIQKVHFKDGDLVEVRPAVV